MPKGGSHPRQLLSLGLYFSPVDAFYRDSSELFTLGGRTLHPVFLGPLQHPAEGRVTCSGLRSAILLSPQPCPWAGRAGKDQPVNRQPNLLFYG